MIAGYQSSPLPFTYVNLHDNSMAVSTQLVWWTGAALEGAILLRGLSTKLIARFPFYYFYIACVFLSDLVRMYCFGLGQKTYADVYWYTELITIVVSYAVVLEIFRNSFRHTPGVARSTRKLLLAIFVLTATFVSLDLLQGGSDSVARAAADAGRYFRYVEGALLLIIVWLVTRYRIRLGRNLLGLIIGNCFWIAFNIANFALWVLPGNAASPMLRTLRPASYLITLAVWCVALWSAQPEPAQPAETDIERDYGVLAAKTRLALARTSNRLVRTIRP